MPLRCSCRYLPVSAGYRQRQWRKRQLLFTPEAQSLPAGHHDPQAGAASQEIGDQRHRAHYLLEVIEHQQQMAVPQVLEDEIPGRFSTRVAEVERGGDGHGHEHRIGHIGERNERRAIDKLRAQLGGEMKREPGLAGTSRTGQRQQRAV